MRKIINISVPNHLYQEVEKEMKKGRYSTKSELFREIFFAWKAEGDHRAKRKFDAERLLKKVRKHAGSTGPNNLSAKHDTYLYGG